MKLIALTLVLDGEPFIERHLPILQQTNLDWRWIVVEGAAQNTGSTSWCKAQPPRLSNDGTTDFLKSITDVRVTCIHSPDWKSKDDQCNAALELITEPCVLLQCDADEIWRPSQLEQIVQLFANRPNLSSIMFACRYWLGERLMVQGNNCFGDFDYEWLRAFRFAPGSKMIRHEPPVLEGDDPARRMGKDESRKLGLVFDHYSYALESQVEYKSRFYGYGSGLTEAWRKLQEHDQFPCQLNRFFAFLAPNEPAKVIRI